MAYGAILNQTFDGFTKNETLNETTISLLGLQPNATPNDAFQSLFLSSSGLNVFSIRVYYPNGQPWANLTINGVTNIQGGSAVTDSDGIALCAAETTNPTISFNPYSDIQAVSQQIEKDSYVITNITIETQYVSDLQTQRRINNTTTLTFSPFAQIVDITAVGGGGGGSGSRYEDNTSRRYHGAGGGGGYVTTETGISLEENGRTITFSIGNGGTGGTWTNDRDVFGAGRSGTRTTVTFQQSSKTITANPGNAATHTSGSYLENGGIGNGNGGNGNTTPDNGTNGTGYIFNESSLGLAGGGGGGSGESGSSSFGGSPNGANGTGSAGANGRAPGGGGSGGQKNGYNNGGAGGKGAVYIRVHY